MQIQYVIASRTTERDVSQKLGHQVGRYSAALANNTLTQIISVPDLHIANSHFGKPIKKNP